MGLQEAKEVLKQFRELDERAQGRLSFQNFLSAMRKRLDADTDNSGQAQLDDDDLRGIFNLLDTTGDGYIDFAEYLCSVAVINGRGQEEETASFKWVFDSLAYEKEQ